MNEIRVMRWVPDSVLQQAREDAARALSAWAGHWGLPDPKVVQATVVASDEPLENGGLAPLREVLQEPTWREALLRALLRFDAGPSAVADGLARRVSDDLRKRLEIAFGANHLEDVVGSPCGHQGIRIETDMFGVACGLELSSAQLLANGRLTPRTLPPLTPISLKSALASAPVPLVAELGHAEVAIDDLLHLSPGDVLLTETRLDQPVQIHSPGSAMRLSAQLGALGDPRQRALRWLPS